MSNRTVSPTLMLKRSRSPSSIDTSASVDGEFQNAPVDDRLVRLQVIAIGHGVFAAERAALADVLEALEVRLAALDARHPRAQHRDQLKPAGPARLDPPGTRERPRPDPAGCPSGTCRAPSALALISSSSSRLDCIERTPTMKNAPRPTASRMTRVWLPGREMCSTACRSGNDGAAESGAMVRTSSRPVQCSASATPQKPAQTMRPTRSEAACHAVNATSAAADQHDSRPSHPVVGAPRSTIRRAAAATA